MHNEKRLVRRLQSGEAPAFEEFVDLYGGRIHHLVRRYVDNPADAEDVTQEIFCDLHRSIGAYRGDSALATWVYRVALNHCLKHLQRRRAEVLPLEEQQLPCDDRRSDPERSATHAELSEQLRKALARLSDPHSEVVVLCEMHGLTYKECAEVVGIPVGTVKSRLSTALRQLRGLLSGYVLGEAAAVAGAETVREAIR